MQLSLDNKKVFFDSSSLLHPLGLKYLEGLKQTIYIPLKAFYELKEMKSPASKAVIQKLQEFYASGKIQFVGEEDDKKDKNSYLKNFSSLLKKYSVVFFTQNRELSKDLYQNLKGQSHSFEIYSFETKGPESFSNHLDLDQYRTVQTTSLEVTTIPDTPLKREDLPKEGDTVYSATGSYKLLSEINKGGEGIIYQTDQDVIAKIYKSKCITKRRHEKLKRLIDLKIDCPGVCSPIEILYNNKEEFIGFTMKKAFGKNLQKSVFVKKLLKKSFPDWNRRDLVILGLTILDKINYLNEHGIILGDINPQNITVVSPTEVYFVDTDSYQVESFPCPVGTINFTAPEIQGKSFTNFLRSPSQEYFAISSLIFMLLLPGKAPYSKRGGESPAKNIKERDFSYPFRGKWNGKTPKGPWAKIWSHLPDLLQEAFYLTFKKNSKYERPEARLSGRAWEKLLLEYLKLLNSSEYLEQDTEALSLFPKNFRKNDPSLPENCVIEKEKPKPKCSNCNKTFEETELVDGLYEKCRKEKEAEKLKELKKEANRVRTKTIHPFRVNKKKTEEKTLICRKCHKSFPDYVMKAGLCPSCRATVPKSQYQSRFEKAQEQKELICRRCHNVVKAHEMQGGLCKACRDELGIATHQSPKATVSGQKRAGTKTKTFSRKKEPKMLICKSCFKSYPDYEMIGGLCPNCRTQKAKPDYKRQKQVNAFNPARDRMFRCDQCKKSYPVSELSGGLCPECRRKNVQQKKEKLVKQRPTADQMMNVFTSALFEDDKKDQTRKALNEIFKDTPVEELSTLVSWLTES